MPDTQPNLHDIIVVDIFRCQGSPRKLHWMLPNIYKRLGNILYGTLSSGEIPDWKNLWLRYNTMKRSLLCIVSRQFVKSVKYTFKDAVLVRYGQKQSNKTFIMNNIRSHRPK